MKWRIIFVLFFLFLAFIEFALGGKHLISVSNKYAVISLEIEPYYIVVGRYCYLTFTVTSIVDCDLEFPILNNRFEGFTVEDEYDWPAEYLSCYRVYRKHLILKPLLSTAYALRTVVVPIKYKEEEGTEILPLVIPYIELPVDRSKDNSFPLALSLYNFQISERNFIIIAIFFAIFSVIFIVILILLRRRYRGTRIGLSEVYNTLNPERRFRIASEKILNENLDSFTLKEIEGKLINLFKDQQEILKHIYKMVDLLTRDNYCPADMPQALKEELFLTVDKFERIINMSFLKENQEKSFKKYEDK